MNNTIGAQTPEGRMYDAIEWSRIRDSNPVEVKVQSDIAFNLQQRRTLRWAAKKWWVFRKQYRIGTIQWDVPGRNYVLNTDMVANFNSADLHVIGEFLREETSIHRQELWSRNCDRASKLPRKTRKRK